MAEAKRKPVSKEAEALGKRIEARRLELRLSQDGLGRRMRTTSGKPVARAQVWRWEHGFDLPHHSRWEELAKALKTTTEALFGGIFIVRPEHEPTLAEQVVSLEDRVEALIRVLDLEAAVDAELDPKAPAVDAAGSEAGDAAGAEADAERADRESEQADEKSNGKQRPTGTGDPDG